ncbi:hypothetical protein DL96DRAFT_1561285 [Flagelloscypha sp. PMI_526]|nr:hypothetical protein DL96DRAFT_1561285 [Flagelloscypha sp. PMI_526]
MASHSFVPSVWGLTQRSIPRGPDLLLQLGEIGFVFWRVFTLPDISQLFTILPLYIPSSLFLLVKLIVDIVRCDGGIWLGLWSPSQTSYRLVSRKSGRGRMARTQPRLIMAKLYLAATIAHLAILAVNFKLFEEDQDSGTPQGAKFLVTWFLPRGLDFGLIVLEIVLLGVGNDPIPFSALVAMNISERALLSLILAFRIWDVVQCGGRAGESFNLLPSYNKGSSRVALLLGRNAWENLSLRGEPVIVKLLRGILAIAALTGLVSFSAILIARDLTSSQNEITSKAFTLNNPKQLNGWARRKFPTPQFLELFVWYGHSFSLYDTQKADIQLGLSNPPIACQIQVQVDFEQGAEIGVFRGPDYNHGVYVSIADGQIDTNTINRIPKAALQRNQALRGDLVFYKHEFVRKSTLNSFGFSASIQTTVGEIKYLSQDPFYTVPNNVSYLKYRYSPYADFIETGVREYTDNTVLDALASIGGLWTFGNGFFALVFGGSLLYFLIGMRPLSRFGFFHLFIRARLRRATREQYPNFHYEGGQPGETEAGVVAFIRQHLLGVIEDEEEEVERRKRRAEWERQRDEMEPLSFEVSQPFRADHQPVGSTQDKILQQKDEGYSNA